MREITICVIRPDQYLFSRSFDELAELFALSLRDLGYSVEISSNRLNPKSLNLLIGYHLLPYFEAMKSCRLLVYQLEPLEFLPEWNRTNALKILRIAEGVWDYSLKNIEFLAKEGIVAKPLFPGYHPGLKRVEYQEPEVDALFYGTVTPRRLAILKKLGEICRLKILDKTFGADRDRWIGKSRTVINLHAYERPLFEAVRISYLWNNRASIWSEANPDQPYAEINFAGVNEEDLIGSFVAWLESKERIEAAAHAAEQFKIHYPMNRLLEEVLPAHGG